MSEPLLTATAIDSPVATDRLLTNGRVVSTISRPLRYSPASNRIFEPREYLLLTGSIERYSWSTKSAKRLLVGILRALMISECLRPPLGWPTKSNMRQALFADLTISHVCDLYLTCLREIICFISDLSRKKSPWRPPPEERAIIMLVPIVTVLNQHLGASRIQ
jgi:hypothetical protein